jgi:hypothetical protein
VEVALEADFVPSGVVVTVGRFLAHGFLLRRRFGWRNLCRLRGPFAGLVAT